jgi:hypothetical protein
LYSDVKVAGMDILEFEMMDVTKVSGKRRDCLDVPKEFYRFAW